VVLLFFGTLGMFASLGMLLVAAAWGLADLYRYAFEKKK
jgi:hypothetical protein